MPRIQAGSDGRGLQIISRVLRNIARYKKTRHSEKDFALLELERDTDIPACEAQNLITLKRAESAVVIGAGMEAAANYEHVSAIILARLRVHVAIYSAAPHVLAHTACAVQLLSCKA